MGFSIENNSPALSPSPSIANAITDQTAPSIALTAPNGGASFTGGTTQDVTWNASDNVGVDSVNVDYSINGNAGPWQPVAHGIANTGLDSVSLGLVPNALVPQIVCRGNQRMLLAVAFIIFKGHIYGLRIS